MHQLVVAAVWCGLIVALLVRATRQHRAFAALGRIDSLNSPHPHITIVIPARNEARNIGRCLRGLAMQRYPRSQYSVVVVNDGSVDYTVRIAQEHVAGFPHVNMRLVHAPALPRGWAGKPHACWVGASTPEARSAEWLCFVDADTAAAPDFLASVVAHAQSAGRDMYSICPRQELRTVWERAFMPIGFMMIAFVYDVRRTGDPSSPDAAANGQCLFIRREAYEECGGHAAVAQEVCEDSALAMRMKRFGRRIGLVDGERVIRTRMYNGWRALCEGLGKNIVESLGGFPETIAAIVLALTLTLGAIGLPLWTAGMPGHGPASIAAFALALLGVAVLLVTYARAARYFEIPVWYAFLFPLGYAVGIAIALFGIGSHLSGSVAWKGRVLYRESQPPARARLRSILRVASKIRLTGARR